MSATELRLIDWWASLTVLDRHLWWYAFFTVFCSAYNPRVLNCRNLRQTYGQALWIPARCMTSFTGCAATGDKHWHNGVSCVVWSSLDSRSTGKRDQWQWKLPVWKDSDHCWTRADVCWSSEWCCRQCSHPAASSSNCGICCKKLRAWVKFPQAYGSAAAESPYAWWCDTMRGQKHVSLSSSRKMQAWGQLCYMWQDKFQALAVLSSNTVDRGCIYTTK